MKISPVVLLTIISLLVAASAFGQSISAAGANRRGAGSAVQESTPRPAETPVPATDSAAGITAEATVLNTPVATQVATPSLEEALKLDDSAVIVVAGADVRIGDLRSSIWAELERASGNPPPTKAIRAKPESDIPDSSIGTSAAAVNRKNAMLRAEEACADAVPWIARVEGTVTSGSRFTIRGACFGDRPGEVELIGNLPQEAQRPAFEEWNKNKIVAVMPRVTGADDGTVAVTVVAATGQRSAAKQAKFFVERESVQVPEERWRPTNHIWQAPEWREPGVDKDWERSGESQFQLAVNPSCWLDVAYTKIQVGKSASIAWLNGDSSKPNEGIVQVAWQKSCLTKKGTETVWLGPIPAQTGVYELFCGLDVTVNATALCPIGVQP